MRPLHSDPPGQEVFFDCFHISLMEIKVNQCYFSASVSLYAGEIGIKFRRLIYSLASKSLCHPVQNPDVI